jgi:hypothetical protein
MMKQLASMVAITTMTRMKLPTTKHVDADNKAGDDEAANRRECRVEGRENKGCNGAKTPCWRRLVPVLGVNSNIWQNGRGGLGGGRKEANGRKGEPAQRKIKKRVNQI